MAATCEVCGDRVVKTIKAERCGHQVRLCETCKRECPTATRYCLKCEDAGR